CITVSREILREGNIHILDGCISPQAAAGRIKIANELRNNEENWNDYFKDSTNRTNSDYNSWLDWFNQNQPRMDEGSFDASWFTGFGDFLASLNEGDVPLPPNLSPAALNAVLSANKRLNELNGNMAYGRKDPIAVDLDWDGVETVSFKEGVNFDLNKDGIKEKTGWIAADDGLLVMDRDDNGTIDNGGELFGDQTPLKDGSIAATGYQALDELDTNKDGYITKEDTDFDKLQVWQDHNQDGVSQYDELYSLTDAGISKINLDYKTGAGEDEQENIQTRIASFEFTDGNIGTTAEYLFSTNNIDTENSDFSNVSDEVKALPYLRGFGLVTDLHHAMANDAALKQMVEEFVNFGNTLTTEGTKNTEANNNQPSTINGILNAKFEAA
ncbi:MAG: hypothetical protein WCR55_10340, partial [Lentisphaerota bacterium]